MKEYICKHYGSLDKCAEELNVGRSTVYRWVQSNPGASYYTRRRFCATRTRRP